jgi:hypothetical protein
MLSDGEAIELMEMQPVEVEKPAAKIGPPPRHRMDTDALLNQYGLFTTIPLSPTRVEQPLLQAAPPKKPLWAKLLCR